PSGACASVRQTSGSSASPGGAPRMPAISSAGSAPSSRLLTWPAPPMRSAPAEKSAANSSTSRSRAAAGIAPSEAAARATACTSEESNCLMSRAAGGLPIVSSRAAAFSGPVSSLSPSISASGMAALRRRVQRRFETRAGDHLDERHAESLVRIVHDDNLAARDHRAVHHHVDRIADPLIKRDDGAAGELHQACDRERRRAEDDL